MIVSTGFRSRNTNRLSKASVVHAVSILLEEQKLQAKLQACVGFMIKSNKMPSFLTALEFYLQFADIIFVVFFYQYADDAVP